MVQTDPDPSASSPVDADTEPHARPAFVALAILATAMLFLGMLGLLYYRWITVRVPSSVLVVEGGPALAGAEVVVEGLGLREPFRQTFGPKAGYTIPFYLDRGSYTLRVERDGQTLFSGDVLLDRQQGKKVSLKGLLEDAETGGTLPSSPGPAGHARPAGADDRPDSFAAAAPS